MREYLRILPQMLAGGLLFFVALVSMMSRVTRTDLVILPFAGALFFGGILALFRKPAGDWLLLFGAAGVLAAGTLLHYLRVAFILRNHGMEGPNGEGSPLAFLLGWAASTIILFIPGLLYSIWNGRRIMQARHQL